MVSPLAEGVQEFHADLCTNNVITMVATGSHKTAVEAREAFAPIVEALGDKDIRALEVLIRSKKEGMPMDEYAELMSQLKSLGALPIAGTVETDEELRTALDAPASVGFVTPVEDASDWLKKSAKQGKIGVIRQPNVGSVVKTINQARGAPPTGHMPEKELCAVKISPWHHFNHMSVATEAANARFNAGERDEDNNVTAVFTGPGFDEDVGDQSPEAHRELIDMVVQNHGRMPASKQMSTPNRGSCMQNLNLVGGAYIENAAGVDKVVSMRQAMHDAIERLDSEWTEFSG